MTTGDSSSSSRGCIREGKRSFKVLKRICASGLKDMPRPRPRTEELLELDFLSKPGVDCSNDVGDSSLGPLFFLRLSGVRFGSTGGALLFSVPYIWADPDIFEMWSR